MPPSDYTRITAFFGSALVTSFLLVGFLFWQNQSEKIDSGKKFDEIQNQLNQIKTPLEKIAFPDYYAASKEMKIFIVAEDQLSYVDSGKNIKGVETKNIKLNGKIENGYLIAQAYVDGGSKLTKVDSIYVNLVDFGGHLLRDKSLSVPESASGHTLILFNLKNVPYLKSIPYDESRIGSTSNWMNILNSNRNQLIHAFLSSARKGGKLVKVYIAYKCNNETPNCEIVELNQ